MYSVVARAGATVTTAVVVITAVVIIAAVTTAAVTTAYGIYCSVISSAFAAIVTAISS